MTQWEAIAEILERRKKRHRRAHELAHGRSRTLASCNRHEEARIEAREALKALSRIRELEELEAEIVADLGL